MTIAEIITEIMDAYYDEITDFGCKDIIEVMEKFHTELISKSDAEILRIAGDFEIPISQVA